MSFLNTQLSFSLNFASFFNAMGVKSSVLFQLKLNLIFTKATHHSANFQTFNCSGEISPNFYFDRLLLLKVYKVSAKKSVEELCLVIPRSHNLHHPPPPPSPTPILPGFLQGWLSLQPNFKKVGGLTGLQLLEGSFWERGKGCNFHIKNKLKSEIFNDKESL